MTQPKIAIIFYSTYGTNHAVALAAAEAAQPQARMSAFAAFPRPPRKRLSKPRTPGKRNWTRWATSKR